MANYLYNGVKLPDINAVYTPELQATHPYAEISLTKYNSGGYYLKLHQAPNWVDTADGKYWLGVGERLMYDLDGSEWVFWENGSGSNGSAMDFFLKETLWSNYNIMDISDNSVWLAASTPVPVTETDHNALIQGWIVGKRLAAMRGNAEPVDTTSVLGDAVLGMMILGE